MINKFKAILVAAINERAAQNMGNATECQAAYARDFAALIGQHPDKKDVILQANVLALSAVRHVSQMAEVL